MFRTPARARKPYRSSILSQAQARSDSAFFMSVTTGCIRCGIFLNCESSTILGSIRISLTSSGRLVIRIDRIIAFRQTDLPVPVRPAISRWGMSARSKASGDALDVLAQEQRDLALLELAARRPSIDLAEPDHRRGGRWGPRCRRSSCPGSAPRSGRSGTARAIARSSARLDDPRDPQAGLQLDLELGDHRPGVDLDDADLVAEVEQGPLQQHGPGVDLGLVLLDRERRGGLEQLERGQLERRAGIDRRGTRHGVRGRRRLTGGRAARRGARREPGGGWPIVRAGRTSAGNAAGDGLGHRARRRPVAGHGEGRRPSPGRGPRPRPSAIRRRPPRSQAETSWSGQVKSTSWQRARPNSPAATRIRSIPYGPNG